MIKYNKWQTPILRTCSDNIVSMVSLASCMAVSFGAKRLNVCSSTELIETPGEKKQGRSWAICGIGRPWALPCLPTETGALHVDQVNHGFDGHFVGICSKLAHVEMDRNNGETNKHNKFQNVSHQFPPWSCASCTLPYPETLTADGRGLSALRKRGCSFFFPLWALPACCSWSWWYVVCHLGTENRNTCYKVNNYYYFVLHINRKIRVNWCQGVDG